MTVPQHIRNRRKETKPRAVLTVPAEFTKEQIEELQRQWNARRLPKHTLILREGFDYKEVRGWV